MFTGWAADIRMEKYTNQPTNQLYFSINNSLGLSAAITILVATHTHQASM